MNAVSTQQNEVSTLSNDIHVITAEINAYQRVAGEAIFEIGKRLKHVKENDLAHGQWERWCREEIGLTPQHSNRFIKVYEELGEANRTTTFGLGVEMLYQIATTPEEQRDRPHTIPSTGETKTVDEMTVRELREVKKALREAEQRTEQAEQRAAEAKHSEEIAMRQLERAEEQLATATKPKEIIVEKPVEKVVTIDNTDYKAVDKLKEYEAQFGPIENYRNRAYSSNVSAVTTSIISFNSAVRDIVRRHSYLAKYQDTIQLVDGTTLREYNEAVQALKEFSTELCKVSSIGDYVDVEFSEVNN